MEEVNSSGYILEKNRTVSSREMQAPLDSMDLEREVGLH